ncbi:unnamed protein product [Closterium sp. Naga37s-1]|nr:unnamed protein product [Closterium sp. Naga37s-1]
MLLAYSLRRPFRHSRLLPRALPFPPPLTPHSPPSPRPLLRSPLCPSLRCLHSRELWSRLNNRPELATSPRRCLPEERPLPDGWAERATSLRRFRLPVALACLFQPFLAIGALNGVTAVGTPHGVTVTDVGGLRRSMRMGIHVPAGIKPGVTVVSARGSARGGIVRKGRGKKGSVKEGNVREGNVIQVGVRAWRAAEETVITKRVTVGRVAVSRKNSTVEVVAKAEESEAAAGAAAAAARPRQRRRGKPKHDKEKDPGEPEQAAEDAYNEDGPQPVVILLDFETTGQGTTQNRIVELALRDVAGGRGAALHTLVNPFPRVISADAERVHGISMRMVNCPSVPHWREAGRLLVDFVEARRAAQAEQAAVSVHSSATTGVYVNTEGGAGMRMGIMSTEMSAVSSAAPLLPPVVLVAHNGWSFDFPLLRNELQRVGIAVPPGWHSLDSMRLVQRLFKDTDRKPASKALGFLFSKHFRCSTPFAHPDLAHRAMADVDKLAEVLAAVMWERGVTPNYTVPSQPQPGASLGAS